MSGAYLSVAAIADQAGFSPRTVLRWVERGDLEAVRFPAAASESRKLRGWRS